MNSTLAAIILVVYVVFTTYKLGRHFLRKHFLRKSGKPLNEVVIKESTFDKRFYSTPSFDFPNIQSEWDMKLVDFPPASLERPNEIKVTHYCKFGEDE